MLHQFRATGRDVYGTATINHWFSNFEYWKVRGISLKLYAGAGPTWGWKPTASILGTTEIDHIAWVVPRTIADARKFSDNADMQDDNNLPPTSYQLFVDEPTTTHRITYWDKPLRIYVKNPNWIERGRSSSTATDWSDVETSDLHRYKWHETAMMMDSKFDTIFVGPTLWIPNTADLNLKQIKFDMTIYMSFKGYRNRSTQ